MDAAGRHVPAHKVRPSGFDAFWLVLTIVNCALILWLLPDRVLKADWFDVLGGKIAPWLATSVFVAGYTWFAAEILAFTRSKAFRVLQAVLFVPLFLLEVPLVTLRAEITPPNAQLLVDGVRVRRTHAEWRDDAYLHDIQLVLRPHRFELRPPDYWEAKRAAAQDIELGWRDMLGAVFKQRELHWSIVWPVTLSAPCSISRVIVIRQNHDSFDNNYLATWGLDQQVWPVASTAPYQRLTWDDRGEFHTLEVEVPRVKSANLSHTVRLPAGSYRFLALGPGLPDDAVDATVSPRQQTFRIEFKQCFN